MIAIRGWAIVLPPPRPGFSGSTTSYRPRSIVRAVRSPSATDPLDQWPGIRPARGRLGVAALVGDPPRALGERANLRARDQLSEVVHPALAGMEVARQPLRIAAEIPWHFLAGEFPDHGPELGQRMKGEAVVDSPDVPLA